jgi:hypothetical protein
MTTVPYHLQHDDRDYALQYVHSSETDAKDDRNERDTPAIVQSLELDRHYYGVYTAATIEKHSTEAADLSDYDSDDKYLIDSVLSLFDIIDDKQNLVWYKPLEPDRIADALDRVEWRQAIPDVGGQLLSNLILAHGLPNANHRTALAFLNAYLATIEPRFEPPATTTASDEWIDWIDEYITESKRLLTLTTNPRLFRWLADHGATQVVRKDGIQIPLDEYDIAGDDPWADLSAEHEQLSIDFVQTYLDQAGAGELAEQRDDGKQAFISRL